MAIENSIIIALIVLFTHATTWPNQLFENVDNWLKGKIPDKIHMPLIGCPICMSPWHGLAWIALANLAGIERFRWTGHVLQDLISTVMTLFAAAGINVVSVMLIKWYEVNQLKEEIFEHDLDAIEYNEGVTQMNASVDEQNHEVDEYNKTIGDDEDDPAHG